jgi:Holliday junction resolvase RusA-like endonuclease
LTTNNTLAPAQVSLLEAATMWRPAHHTYTPLRKARKSSGWAANVAALPLPPSTNGLFAGKVRRYKSKAYKAWEKEAAPWWDASPLSQQAAWPLDKAVVVLWTLDLYVFMPTWRGDLDNEFKAVIDFLCERTGLRDNRLVELHAKRITGHEKLCGLVLGVGLA